MAIAYDSTSQITSSGWSSGTSMTWSHTCSGLNRYLIVGVSVGDTGSDIVSGVTYNGVAMTRLKFATFATGGRSNYLYGLANPASGAHNIVVSNSSSSNIHGNAVSYTGVAQTGQPDSTNNGSTNSGTSLSVSTTVVTANSWVIGIFSNTSANTNSHTGITPRSNNSTIGIDIGDSNAAESTGSYTMTETGTVAGNWGAVVASISPVINTSSGFFNLL